MEKLAYVVWKRDGDSDQGFAERLRGDLAPGLKQRGARFLTISVVDDEVARGAGIRIGQADPPKAGLVTFWVDQAQERGDLEGALRGACGSIAGYLVLESRPLRPTAQIAAPGERTPGFHLITCITPKPGLSHEEFMRFWHERFRDVAIETQSTFDYVRNEIVRPLTPGAPPWAGIVEEGFPLGALDDPNVFYDALGDAGIRAAHQKRMVEHVAQFLDLPKVESHPMSQFVYERMTG